MTTLCQEMCNSVVGEHENCVYISYFSFHETF